MIYRFMERIYQNDIIRSFRELKSSFSLYQTCITPAICHWCIKQSRLYTISQACVFSTIYFWCTKHLWCFNCSTTLQMTSEVCIAVISALDLDFLPGDYLDKLREETQTSTARPSRIVNEDNYLNSDTVRVNKKANKKKVAKKKDKNKILRKMQKPEIKTPTTTPIPRVLSKPDIRRIQQPPLSRENITEQSLSITKNQIYQPNYQSNSVLSSLVDQIPLTALTHLLPGISSLIESRNSVSTKNQGTELSRVVQVPVDFQSPTPTNTVVQYKNRETQLLPLTPSQYRRINRHPNRNAILQSLRDILGARPLSHMLQVPVLPSGSQPEVRQKSSAQNLNVGQSNVIDVSIPFQRKGMGPLKFFNWNP